MATALLLSGCAGKAYIPGTPEYDSLKEDVGLVGETTHTAICVVDTWVPDADIAAEVSYRAEAALTQLQEGGVMTTTYEDILLGAVAAATDDEEVVYRVEGALMGLEAFWQMTFGAPLPGLGEELEEPYGEFTIMVLEDLSGPCHLLAPAP